MKVYLSGPMTHGGTRPVTDAVRSAFTLAASHVHAAGHEPVNPLDWANESASWSYQMRRSIAELIKCDAIYLLPGWDQSRGAYREAAIASEIGLSLLEPLNPNTEPPPSNFNWNFPGGRPTSVIFDELALPRDLPFAPTGSYQNSVATGGLRLPTRSHPGDAGFDLYVTEEIVVPPGEFVDIHCHLAVEMPEGVWGLVIGRSSTLRKRQLMVNPGIIDTGYRGELFTGVWNMGSEPALVEYGDRLAQFILFPNVSEQYVPVMVRQLSDSSRGTRGFGSSGR